MWRILRHGLPVFLAASGWGFAQIADRNINMVSGTTWPDGDPFLQRQNEPSMAASSRNPRHWPPAAPTITARWTCQGCRTAKPEMPG